MEPPREMETADDECLDYTASLLKHVISRLDSLESADGMRPTSDDGPPESTESSQPDTVQMQPVGPSDGGMRPTADGGPTESTESSQPDTVQMQPVGPNDGGRTRSQNDSKPRWRYPQGLTKDSRDLQQTLASYVRQLREGCGNATCTEILCHTGRVNTSCRPVRRYTELSARAIALNACSRPQPRAHLCKYFDLEARVQRATPETTRHDPTSGAQIIASTTAIERAIDGTLDLRLQKGMWPLEILRTRLDAEDRELHQLQQRARACGSERERKALIENMESSIGRVAYNFNFLLCLSAGKPREYLNPGDGYDWHSINAVDPLGFLRHYLAMNHQPLFEILDRLMLLTEEVRQTLCILHGMSGARATMGSIREVARLMNIGFKRRQSLHFFEHRFAIPWLRLYLDIHTREFKDTTLLSNAGALAAQMLTQLVDIKSDSATSGQAGPTMEVPARTWLQCSRTESSAIHVFHFPVLSWKAQLLKSFRTVNYLRMRQATTTAHKVHLLRLETVGSVQSQVPRELRMAEGYYLLLSVSRETVLKDAFDQLWQREQHELLRPLRVRLDEVSELDFGQDLGGVQVEFFNLLLREVLADEARMFVHDDRSGIYWLCPGSLQPLYMFELFGVLLGLALYNGITLPMNLPHYFYLVACNERPSSFSQLISDRWSEIHRHLANLDDATLEDLEFAFPVDANGLRLSACYHGSMENGLHVMEVYDITIVGESYPSSGSGKPTVASLGIADAWPGWHLIDAPSPAAPVTPATKENYITAYANWLVHVSVLPQLLALRRGFERLFPVPQPNTDNSPLTILGGGARMQQLVEGIRTLDIAALRAATTYEGFRHPNTYIACFWDIVQAWDPARQMRLLKFVTAFERVPAGGERALHFVIARAEGHDLDRLPTSSTCFGKLYLPVYPDKETLKQKLELAVDMGSEGFGIS